MAAFPSLSELLEWPTEHLTEAADYWEMIGARCFAVASQVWRDALSIDWEGEAAEALRTGTHADMLITSGVDDQLHEAAKVARGGASDLYAARSRMRYAVEDARAAGFDVGEDCRSPTDRLISRSAAQRAVRRAQACCRRHSSLIRLTYRRGCGILRRRDLASVQCSRRRCLSGIGQMRRHQCGHT
jgi:hypothetical protein